MKIKKVLNENLSEKNLIGKTVRVLPNGNTPGNPNFIAGINNKKFKIKDARNVFGELQIVIELPNHSDLILTGSDEFEILDENLNEAIDTEYHHGTFKDLQTFLDKYGDPYKLQQSKIYGKDVNDMKNPNNSSNDNSNNQDADTDSDNDFDSDDFDNGDDSTDNNSSDDDSNNDVNYAEPDPSVIYEDISTGKQYKYNETSHEFEEVTI